MNESFNDTEVDKILENAKAKAAENLAKKQKEATELASTIKFKKLEVRRDSSPGYEKYFFFDITTDQETYNKVKNKYFNYSIEVEGTNGFQEDSTKGSNAPTRPRPKTSEGFVFETYPSYGQPKDGKTYVITGIWLEDDPKKTNLIDTPVKFQ